MKKVKYHIGTSGWNYQDWRQVFYPEKLPQKEWLAFYARTFSTLEVNATFYRSFKKDTFIKWEQTVPKNFRYIIKVNRYITHIKYLKNCKTEIKKFIKPLDYLQDKLGLILLQLAPKTAYDLERLKKALLAFGDPTKLCVEFRSSQWLTPAVKDLLTELGCVFCAVDSPTMSLTDWLTSPTAYIRLHGRERWYNYEYTQAELQTIARFVKKLAARGAKEIYILFNNDYSAFAIKNALYLHSLLEK